MHVNFLYSREKHKGIFAISIIIFSCSLNKNSKSRLLSNACKIELEAAGMPAAVADLADVPIPLCDGGPSYGNDNVKRLIELSTNARGIIVSMPIYNYSENSALKSLMEHCGRQWTDKVVGFLCAAGGKNSYMAPMGTANALMLDFRCLIVPRFVYATTDDFVNDQINNDNITHRIKQLSLSMVQLVQATTPS